MKGAFFAGDALHNQARVFVNENTHRVLLVCGSLFSKTKNLITDYLQLLDQSYVAIKKVQTAHRIPELRPANRISP
jgi:protein-disulfide isomerase-like protein with CxxC motif